MASGGSSGRPHAVSRSFDFGTDDVLCSYDDMAGQDHSNGRRSDSTGKDFRESGRVGRPLVDIYSQREDPDNRDVLTAVEKCMKKYADNLLRYLEGISGRLSQLEHTCYDLERSVGDIRTDMARGHGESDLKLKSLDKHLQEVHRSVQILRDKQELAETQRELAKLQLAASKEASDSPAAAPEPNQQLALPPPPKPAEPMPPASSYAYPQRSQMIAPMQPAAPPAPSAAPPPPLPPQQPEQAQYAQTWPHQQPAPQQFSQPPPQQFSQPPAYQPGQDVYPGGRAPPPFAAAPPVVQSSYSPQQVSKPGGYGGGYYYQPPSQAAPPPHQQGGPAAPAGRSHPYAELIDKAVNMGYPRDHVFGAVRRMEETGQPVDFNSLLDLLNARPAPRGWHG